MQCTSCGSTELVHYTEKHLSVKSGINKNNTISKIKKDILDVTYGVPDHIECEGCQRVFDYDLDSKGRITDLHERF